MSRVFGVKERSSVNWGKRLRMLVGGLAAEVIELRFRPAKHAGGYRGQTSWPRIRWRASTDSKIRTGSRTFTARCGREPEINSRLSGMAVRTKRFLKAGEDSELRRRKLSPLFVRDCEAISGRELLPRCGSTFDVPLVKSRGDPGVHDGNQESGYRGRKLPRRLGCKSTVSQAE